MATMELIKLYPEPVLSPDHPDCANTRFGFEGGTVMRLGGMTYLFTTENYGEPKICMVRLSAWKSSDGVHFYRVGSLRDTYGRVGDRLSFSCPWSPNVQFSKEENRWVCHYVHYTHKKPPADPWNLFGRTGVLKSSVPGINGIEGPWVDFGQIALADEPQEWEGPCGQVSFFPYQVGDRWYAFFGSNSIDTILDADSTPQDENTGGGGFRFSVGLAESSSIAGPWHRLESGNPVAMDPRFIENPVPREIPGIGWITVFDGGKKDAVSYSYSDDGVHWSAAERLGLPADRPAALNEVRTPLGLVENADGTHDLFFTAYDGRNAERVPPLWHDGFGHLWRAQVRLEPGR